MNDQSNRADVDAIVRTKHLYGAVIDGLTTGDHAEADLDLVFSPDAAVELAPGQRTTGIAAIKEFFGKTMPSLKSSMWHSFANPIVDVDGDQARGQWTVLAYTKGPNDPTSSVTFGRYKERYVRTPQGWRISELVFTRMS